MNHTLACLHRPASIGTVSGPTQKRLIVVGVLVLVRGILVVRPRSLADERAKGLRRENGN